MQETDELSGFSYDLKQGWNLTKDHVILVVINGQG